jgi:hypothetical protein
MLTTFVMGLFRGLSVAISVAVVNPYTLILFAISFILMWILLKISIKVLQES